MNNEQKKQMLEYMGYFFRIAIKPSDFSIVIMPDNLKYITGASNDVYDSDYEEKEMNYLLKKAWKHHEERERVLQMELIIYDNWGIAFPNDKYYLYEQLYKKWEGLERPQMEAVFYCG